MDHSKKPDRLDHDHPDPIIVPPSDDQLYELESVSKEDPISLASARKWQVPDDTREEPETGEIYTCQENSEETHQTQNGEKAMIQPLPEEELYSVKEGETPIASQPAPDMQVLFEDAQFHPDDLYAIGSGPHPTEADAQELEGIRPKSFEYQNEESPLSEQKDISISQNEIKRDSTNLQKEEDLYGVSEPEKPFYASDILNPNRLYDDPDEIDGSGPLLENISVDAIYSRRMFQDKETLIRSMEGTTDSKKIPDVHDENPEEFEEEELTRPKIPIHPFRNGILLPLKSPGFILRLLLISVAGLVPFYLGIWFFSRHNNDMKEVYQNLSISVSSTDSETEAQNLQQTVQSFLNRPMVNAFLGLIYKDRIALFFVCFVWGIFTTPYFLQVFTATASGDDKISEWPEEGFFTGVTQFLWLLMLVLGSGIPGWFLLKRFGYAEVGFITGTILLAPIFFLSCMATDSYARILSSTILKSFKSLIRFWRWFYLLSILLLLIGAFLFCCFLWMVVTDFENPHGKVILASFLSAIVFSILPILYLRYLGRLAWVIQDNTEKKQKEDREKGNGKEEDEPILLMEESDPA